MVTIGKLGAGQGRYYTAQVAEGAEEYYAGEGEAPGRWEGELARELGLSGAVEADQLTAMLSGEHPGTGDPLGLRAVGGRGPVPGFDITFSRAAVGQFITDLSSLFRFGAICSANAECRGRSRSKRGRTDA